MALLLRSDWARRQTSKNFSGKSKREQQRNAREFKSINAAG